MHPYAIQWLTGSKVGEFIRAADSARLAAQMPREVLRRRGLGIAERFTRRLERRRVRDVAY